MKRNLIYLFTCLFSLQSCVVYQKTPVNIGYAIERGKVKVVANSGKKSKYKNISFSSDGSYIGMKGGNSYNINEEDISEIFLKDFKKSKWGTIGAIVLGVGLGYLVLFLIAFSISGLQM